MRPLLADMNARTSPFRSTTATSRTAARNAPTTSTPGDRQMFNAFKAPVVYVPGDNEWTDCHRINNGGYDNLERLDHLRKRHVRQARELRRGDHDAARTRANPARSSPRTSASSMAGSSSSGSTSPAATTIKVHDDQECTSKSARTPTQCAADNTEYAERDAANVAWMQEAFELARSGKAPGIVLVFQADPGFDLPETEDVNERKAPGLRRLHQFPGQVGGRDQGRIAGQVLIVHGDTHYFKVDKPLIDKARPDPEHHAT